MIEEIERDAQYLAWCPAIDQAEFFEAVAAELLCQYKYYSDAEKKLEAVGKLLTDDTKNLLRALTK
jgi:hypothetical protein